MRVASALRRAVAGRVAVQAARMLEHLAGLDEERRRARGGVANTSEVVRRTQRARTLPAYGWRKERHRRYDRHARHQDLAGPASHAVLVPSGASPANGYRRSHRHEIWKTAFATAGALSGDAGTPTPASHITG